MNTKERILSGEEKINDILSEYVDLIWSLYTDGIADSFGEEDEESSTEDSHITICTLIALCFLNNRDKISYPFDYSDIEESVFYEVVEAVDFILQLENIVHQGHLKREIINGKAAYSSLDVNTDSAVNKKIDKIKSNKKKKKD